MYTIVNAELNSPYLEELRLLVSEEWDEFAPFEKFDKLNDNMPVPLPILALEGQKLIGGLAFSRYKLPERETIDLWINAVLILPEHRGKGIASSLIRQADDAAKHLNVKQLYANTYMPMLYTKLGWEIVKTDKNGTVMIKML